MIVIFFPQIYFLPDPYFFQYAGTIMFRECQRFRLSIRMLSFDICVICSRRQTVSWKDQGKSKISLLFQMWILKVCVELNRRRSRGKDEPYSHWGSILCQEKGKGWEARSPTNAMEGTAFCLWSLPEDLNSYNSSISQEELCFSHFKLYEQLQTIWAIRPKVSCILRIRHFW